LVPISNDGRDELGEGVTNVGSIPIASVNSPPFIGRVWTIWVGAAIILALIGIGVIGMFVLKPETTIQEPMATDELARWQVLPAMPTARFGLGFTALDDRLYAIGGITENGPIDVVEIFNLKTNQWTDGPAKPTPVGEIAAAVIRGRILVPGGRLSSGEVSRKLEIYDPTTKAWTQGAPIPIGLSAYALAAYEGRLYLFGGWDGKDFTNRVFSYDIESNRWDEMPPMPTRRGYATAAVAGQKVYLMGGFDGKRALSDNEVFVPDLAASSTEAWDRASPLPVPVQDIGSVSIADNIYILGSNPSPNQSDITFIYTPQSGSWRSFEMPQQAFGEGIRTVGWGPNIYALGWANDQKPVDTHLVYQAVVIISFPVISK
jgi:hypothetical protein